MNQQLNEPSNFINTTEKYKFKESEKSVPEHIEEISGVKDNRCKWIVVTCDGIPHNYIQKMKTDFPWFILIPGTLHEEMNMLKAFVELN
ncbi:hypothetical protein Glove_562g13 [Diversispora epigaea]|uniref:Uncharacterized protein n=1 Tax=Diversispora epigaea TaxID=1348612 RepID=A0A397GG84_9GLOM|nr:hypothetical protein Glove_562g13 [Diversispora epigaea]